MMINSVLKNVMIFLSDYEESVIKKSSISSVECQKGIIAIQRCSVENQRGAIAVQSVWW